MSTPSGLLLWIARALIVGVVVYGIVWWGAQKLGQSGRQAEGWAWIAVIATMFLSGFAGDGWVPRFAKRSDAAGLAGSNDDAEPERR